LRNLLAQGWGCAVGRIDKSVPHTCLSANVCGTALSTPGPAGRTPGAVGLSRSRSCWAPGRRARGRRGTAGCPPGR
jgi:hypothetical protein